MAEREIAKKFVEDMIAKHKTVLFVQKGNPLSDMADKALRSINVNFHSVDVYDLSNPDAIKDALFDMTDGREVS